MRYDRLSGAPQSLQNLAAALNWVPHEPQNRPAVVGARLPCPNFVLGIVSFPVPARVRHIALESPTPLVPPERGPPQTRRVAICTPLLITGQDGRSRSPVTDPNYECEDRRFQGCWRPTA